jgi:hypothetical protein
MSYSDAEPIKHVLAGKCNYAILDVLVAVQ